MKMKMEIKKILILLLCFVAPFSMAAYEACNKCVEAHVINSSITCGSPHDNDGDGTYECDANTAWDSTKKGECETIEDADYECDDDGVTTDLVVYEWECEVEVTVDGDGDWVVKCVKEKTGNSKTKSSIADCRGIEPAK